jgi:HAD superfamily hydrolase (TIGR01509 family)
MIRGVLFDMDGVLADSEQFICGAAMMMFREAGFTVMPGDFKPFVGTGENMYIGGVAEKYNIALDIEKAKARTYEIYQEIIKGRLEPLPGARELVELCAGRGLKLALATSADKIKMTANLDEIGIPVSVFHAVVTGLDVEKRKPSPEIYIKAAGKIGLPPDECLVVEDAVSGVKAARAAGCKCLAVTTSFSRPMLHEADWICDSLLEAPADALTW